MSIFRVAVQSTGLFEMIVGVFYQLVIHNTLEIAVYVFFY